MPPKPAGCECNRVAVWKFPSPEAGQAGTRKSKVERRVILVAGTHGNEPAGSVYLTSFVKRYQSVLDSWGWLPAGTELVVVPALNPCAIRANQRNHPCCNVDLNRQYGSKGSVSNVRDVKSLVDEVSETWVVDLHEAWGWADEGKGSLGSAVYYSISGQVAAKQTMVSALENLMSEITEANRLENRGHQFLTRPDIGGPRGTLGEYVRLNVVNNGRRGGYFLLETTGQNNITPLDARVRQVEQFIRGILVDVIKAVQPKCGRCRARGPSH
jgi:hypothetical protein